MRKDLDNAKGPWYVLYSILGTYLHHLVSKSNEFVLHLTTEIAKATQNRGSDVMQGLQRMDKGLWDHPAMDPDSCGVVNVLAPIGPWAQSEYSPPLSCVSDVQTVVLKHQIGANPEEHQRLSMLGTLERQNVRVSDILPHVYTITY